MGLAAADSIAVSIPHEGRESGSRFANRALFSWGLRAVTSAALLWYVARKVDLQSVIRLVDGARWSWLAAAFAVMLVSRGLSVRRMVLLMQASRKRFHAKEVGRIVLGSEFFGAFLPSSIGGDGLRIYGLRRHTADTNAAASAVFLERGIGVLALLAFGSAGTLWARPRMSDHALFLAAFAPSCAALAIAFAALNERWVSWLLGWGGERWTQALRQWQQAVRAYRRYPAVLAEVVAISLLIQLLRIVCVYLSALTLGATLPFAYYLAFVPLILLISMLPVTIGGLGIRENAFVHTFAPFGMAPATAFGVSITAHAVSTLAHAPGGLWAVWARGRTAHAVPQEPLATDAPAATPTVPKYIPVRTIGRKKVVDRIPEVLRLCRGRRVLHLGCADYPFTYQPNDRFLHKQLSDVATELWGVDASPEGVAALRARGFSNLIVSDVERLDRRLLPAQPFDVIVAGELIEHLESPGGFLRLLRSIMGPQTELIVTTPNAPAFKLLLFSLLGREKVHQEHHYYFSYFTIAQLLEKTGLRSKEIYYYQDVSHQGLASAIDGCIAVISRIRPVVSDGLFVRAAVREGAKAALHTTSGCVGDGAGSGRGAVSR